MGEEIRKEVEGNIRKVGEGLGKIGEGIKKLAVKLFGLVLAFWLILIAFGIGVGVPIYLGKEILGAQISKMTEGIKKDMDPGMQGAQNPGLPQFQAMSPVRETYYIQSVKYERPVPMDRNLKEAGHSFTELRRIMNTLVSLKD